MHVLFSILLLSCLGNVFGFSLPSLVIKPYECEQCDRLSHTPLSLSWPTHGQLVTPTVSQQKSTKYHVETTADELKHGLTIYTLAPKAIIDVIPLNKKISLQDAQFYLSNDKQFNLPLAKGHRLGFQLTHKMGKGKFLLTLAQFNGASSERFQIRVFDKYATTSLQIKTNKSTYQVGETLFTTISLRQGNHDYLPESTVVNLVSPDSQQTPIPMEAINATTYQGNIKLTREQNFPGQNWYIEADVVAKIGKEVIKRHVHTAFSYAIPSAQITDIIKPAPHALNFRATVHVATGSRYALQAILFKKQANGEKQAVEIAQTANWLSPGKSTLSFSFKQTIANADHSPYYLGSIQLIDYGQLKPVFEYHKFIGVSGLG